MSYKIWVESDTGYDLFLIDNFNYDGDGTIDWIETKTPYGKLRLWESDEDIVELQEFIVSKLINAIIENKPFVSIPSCIGEFKIGQFKKEKKEKGSK